MLRPPPISAISASAQPQEEYLLEDFDPQIIPDAGFSKFILTGRWRDTPENDVAFKSPKEPKELKELKELEELEELKELELSEKKKKVEELQEQLNTIKTLTPKLFKDLSDEIEKLITQIEKETNTVKATTKHRITISEIITKIEDSKIYESFEQNKNKNPEKDPTKAIITKILADDPKIDEEFKKLFENDPDSITKIITPILKENAIKKIIDEIKSDTSEESQTEENKFDSFGKIIAKILEKDSLISKYYKKDSYSIAGIIDQLQSEKTVEDPIKKITTRILDENAKAFQAIAEDPLGQIIIEHKIEKANSPQKEEADTKKIVVKGQEVKTQIYSNINQEIVEQILFKDEAELPITKSVEKEILDAYQDRSKIENESKKTTFLSKFYAKIPQKKGNTILVSSDSGIKSDIVFVKLDESLDLIQAEEKLAEKEKDGKDLDEKKLLIYAELIAKIPKEYSESISPTHQEIIYLKKQEKGHKKTLNFLKELIEKEEKIIAEKKRIAKEITEQEGILYEIASEIASEEKRYFAEVEEAKRVAEVKEAKRVAEVEEAKRFAEEQKPIETETFHSKIEELENKISQVEQDLIQTKTYIESNIREILSSEYVDERLASYPEKSIIDQFLIEAIIVDEAKKQFTPEEIGEIKNQQHHSVNTSLEAFNLHVLKKALEKKFESEQNAMGIVGEAVVIEDVSAINITQTNIAFYKTQNHLYEKHDKIRALECESEQLKISLYHLKIALEREQNPINPEILTLLPESPSTTDSNTNSSWVDQQLAAFRGEAIEEDRGQFPRSESQTYFTETISLPKQLSSQNPILGLQESAEGPFVKTLNSALISPSEFQSASVDLQKQNNPFIVPKPTSIEDSIQDSAIKGFQDLELQPPPPPPANEVLQTSNKVPILNLDEIDKKPQPILRTQEEKNNFWQTFISTRLREKPTNSNQNSPRNDDEDPNQNQLDERSQPSSSTSESESLEEPSTFYSKEEEDEIKKRRIGLYTILLANLEEQITKKLNSSLNNENSGQITDEEENTAEMNATNATTIFDTVMDYIVTYTPDLDSSISEVGNNQTGETHQSKPLDIQTTQNSSTDDPIIYSGIGIRIKLEKEERGEYFLRITEVFDNSDLKKEDVDKKITQIECEGNLKSISDIYTECGSDDEKFYTKIAVIFRDPNKTLRLKIEGEDQERDVKINIFIPRQRNIFDIKDNSQLTKIAQEINARRESQNSTPLSSPRNHVLATI